MEWLSPNEVEIFEPSTGGISWLRKIGNKPGTTDATLPVQNKESELSISWRNAPQLRAIFPKTVFDHDYVSKPFTTEFWANRLVPWRRNHEFWYDYSPLCMDFIIRPWQAWNPHAVCAIGEKSADVKMVAWLSIVGCQKNLLYASASRKH